MHIFDITISLVTLNEDKKNESEKLKIGCLFVYRLELRTGIYYVFESRQEGKRLPVY